LVYLFDKLGVETGISLKLLRVASHMIAKELGRDLPSRVLKVS